MHLGDVAISDQAQEMTLLIHHGKFLNLILEKDICGRREVGVACSHKVLFSHHIIDCKVHVGLEAEVAVGDDTDKLIVGIHHGYAADTVVVHKLESLPYGLIL